MTSEEPLLKKNNCISAIWMLPGIALCICIWLLYSSYENAGEDILVYFEDASGIIPGKTQVVTRGIPLGLVEKITPDLANNRVIASISIEKEAVQYLVTDTLFWVVRPELSVNSIQGLDTILSGSYIGIQPGVSKEERREFDGLSSAPPVPADTPGLHLQLQAESLGSIQKDSGIYYRNIEIGKVQKYELIQDKNILVDVFIEPQFAHLVRSGSRFCNSSGIQMSGKLPNIKLRVQSLASLLRGGILLYTPEPLQDTPKVTNGHIFTLYEDYEAANYGVTMTLTLSSGKDIVEGSTKVMYRGLEAGFVKEITINDDNEKTVTAHILLDPRAEFILKDNTKFWLVKPEVSPSGLQNLQLLISGSHITFQPGDGEFRNHFNIQPEPPKLAPLRAGKTFLLSSDGPSAINEKSPVYFKNIKVGEVIDIEIPKSAKNLVTRIYIYEEYLHLLSTHSIFWMHSGVEIDASINTGFDLKTGPLTSLLLGGISFTTPDKLAGKKNFRPEENTQFQLFASYNDAIKSLPEQPDGRKHITIKAATAKSLSIGAPILYKSVAIGKIEAIELAKDGKDIVLSASIADEFKKFVGPQSKFYNISGVEVSGGFAGLRLQTGTLQSIIAGGIGCINLSEAPGTPAGKSYTLYDSLDDALHTDKIALSIAFADSKGLKTGSAVRYKGVEVGLVSSLHFAKDLKHMVAKVYIDKSLEKLFRENTKIWVAEAEINLDGVHNLETMVFGSFLNFLPGDGTLQRNFEAVSEPPRDEIANREGLGIVLETSHLGSISTGSPIYYRQVQVGQVTGYKLSPTFQKVFIYCSIQDRYSAVVRKNTKFWNVSGITVEGGLFSGVSLTTESLQSVIRGGIALATPDGEKPGIAAQPGDHFKLHDKLEKKWLDWSPDVIIFELEDSKKILSGK